MNNKKARVIAFYLPQYHPIPENDEWWGKGFTEWTNVAKAKPLFKGHYQPKIPADLGFYDLRMPEAREAQAKMAKEAGIEGFCYWHYWFGNGKRLLEKPFNEVLKTGKPDFPFCLSWGNHSWVNSSWSNTVSKKKSNRIIVEQKYQGKRDYTAHFYAVLEAFKDPRYITVDGKPVFFFFNSNFPQLSEFMSTWRKLAKENGLKGIHFIGISYNSGFRQIGSKEYKQSLFLNTNEAKKRYLQSLSLGVDAINSVGLLRAEYLSKNKLSKLMNIAFNRYLGIKKTDKYDQKKIIENLYVPEDKWENVYPTIIPNWDRSPRIGKNCSVYTNSTPEVFAENIRKAIGVVRHKKPEHRIIVLKSWNEWGEGNYVEPDLKYGKGYINALRKELIDDKEFINNQKLLENKELLEREELVTK
jgi:hypothetical protein